MSTTEVARQQQQHNVSRQTTGGVTRELLQQQESAVEQDKPQHSCNSRAFGLSPASTSVDANAAGVDHLALSYGSVIQPVQAAAASNGYHSLNCSNQ